MKFISGCSLTSLLLSVLITKETEALAPVILARLGQLADRQGSTLAKMTYYAKCSTVNELPEMKCLSLEYFKNIPVHLYNTKIYIIPN